MRDRASLAPTDAALRADLCAWAAAVEPVVRCMRAMHEKLDLEDLRKQLRQRPARIRDAPTTPPEESRTVRRALAAQRALAVDSLAAECAARLAMAWRVCSFKVRVCWLSRKIQLSRSIGCFARDIPYFSVLCVL